MAAVLMQQGQAFDPQDLYLLTETSLPRYAAPVFVRVTQSADLTASFKLRKVDLQRQGYCPSSCSDPLFIRDDQARTYVPYSLEALTRLGLAPFAVASHD